MKQFFEQYRLLIAITLAGLVLRLWQLGWGLPELFEEATPMSIALRMWTSPHLDLNPHFFNYPALAFYLHLIVQLIVYGVGSLFGAFPNPAAFSSSLATLVITARAFTALVDTATIVVVYLICMNLMEKRTALIAAG